MYKLYAGDKNIIRVEGDHNSERPSFMNDSVAIFFHNTLMPYRIEDPPSIIKCEGEKD